MSSNWCCNDHYCMSTYMLLLNLLVGLLENSYWLLSRSVENSRELTNVWCMMACIVMHHFCECIKRGPYPSWSTLILGVKHCTCVIFTSPINIAFLSCSLFPLVYNLVSSSFNLLSTLHSLLDTRDRCSYDFNNSYHSIRIQHIIYMIN